MKERILFGGLALVIFLPVLWMGGVPFQILVGLLAMIGVAEIFKMKRIEIFSFEGLLAMLGAFVLAVPMDHYLSFLPLDASLSSYTIITFFILAGTVLNHTRYSFDDAIFPIAASFYVGIGF